MDEARAFQIEKELTTAKKCIKQAGQFDTFALDLLADAFRCLKRVSDSLDFHDAESDWVDRAEMHDLIRMPHTRILTKRKR